MGSGHTYRCWCKGVRGMAGPPQRGKQWVSARRAWFVVHGDRVEVGDWILPVDEVAHVIEWRTSQGLWRYSVLELQHEGTHYLFGFNPWVRVFRRLPFEAEPRDCVLGWSRYSIVMRVAWVILLILWLTLVVFR